jgi:hypothetical protein
VKVHGEPTVHSKILQILIGQNTPPISFAPEDSDLITNALAVEQVIGTLTRLSSHGRYEPYLAESWEVSEDKLQWEFRLRAGNRCEDGTEINAPNYVEGLKKVLRLMARHTDIPIVNQLRNWDDFQKEKGDLVGVSASGVQTVRFQFVTPPSSGFLEYLGLPYMGFYCASDFNPDGSWKDPHFAVSSAAYAVKEGNGNFPVHLKKRPGWFSSAANSPDELVIESYPFDEAVTKIGPNTALYESLENRKEKLDGFQIVNLIPSFFSYVVINPKRSPYLRSPEHRAAIRNSIDARKRNAKFDFSGSTRADALYPHMAGNLEPIPSYIRPNSLPGEPLIVIGALGDRPAFRFVRGIVESALTDLGIPFQTPSPDQAKKGHMAGWKDESAFDIKIGSVDVGGGIENQLIKFMFCSKLGTSFPDPSGRICSLVEEFEKKYGDVMTEEAIKEYSHRLNSIIHEDAAVVPIMHFGPNWILGDRIDPTGFSPTMGIPYFDQVTLR